MALIELDLSVPPEQPVRSRPPARHYRTAGLLLAVALLFTLGGAAAPPALIWRYLGALPAPGTTTSFQLGEGRAYVSNGFGPGRTVTAWTLAPSPARLWTVPFPSRVVGTDQVAFGDVRARPAGPVVLLTDGPQTVAVDPGSGAVRWRADLVVQPIPGDRIGLEQDPQFDPGTDYDQDSGAPGPLYFSATGVPHDKPPRVTVLRGIDLRTGAVAWTVSRPGSVVAYPTARGVAVLEARRLSVLATGTGAALRSIDLPPQNGGTPASGQAAGDLALVQYEKPDGDQNLQVVYSLRDLQVLQQWSGGASQGADAGTCTGLLCIPDGDAEIVVSPAGQTQWRASGMDVIRFGDELITRKAGGGDPIAVVDARNGHPRVSLAGWGVDQLPDDGTPLILRRATPTGSTMFGLVEPGTPGLRVLGTSRGIVAACQSDQRFLVCGGLRSLQVYAYRN